MRCGRTQYYIYQRSRDSCTGTEVPQRTAASFAEALREARPALADPVLRLRTLLAVPGAKDDLGGPDSRCQFVLDTQDRADASFKVPSDPPHPSLGRQSPPDGNLD